MSLFHLPTILSVFFRSLKEQNSFSESLAPTHTVSPPLVQIPSQVCVSTAKSKPPLDESFSELQALIRIDACPSQPVSRNVILELCEGPDAPLSTAAASQGYVFLKDADLWPLQGSAILQDRHFYKLLSLARTGVVVYWHASTGYLATSAETNIAGSTDSPTVLSRTCTFCMLHTYMGRQFRLTNH